MIPNCTLTTACFDITPFFKGSRSLDDCINNMKQVLEVPCYLVIYADSNCMTRIQEIRNGFGLKDMTSYVQLEFNELPKYIYTDIVKSNREKYWPTRDERTCAESHLLVCSKFDLVLKTMEINPFNTSKFGWIDSNAGLNFSKMCENYKKNMLLHILNNISDKFHIQIMNVCDKKYKEQKNKREMYEKYRWIVCGCLFTMGVDIGKKILSRLNEIAVDTTKLGYGHGEEAFFLDVLDEFYDDIERSYGDYKNILNNFIRPTNNFYYINNFIIKKYLHHNYHKEGYDCCKKILYEIENFNVDIGHDLYVDILFSFYLFTFYYKNKEEARKVVEHIKSLVSENPYIKNEYDKKRQFYESQFNYSIM
jgi:hypothetical protein